MKLICFPHAGGFAFYFNFIKRIETLDKEDVFLYEYPGRGYRAREPGAKSLMDIAQKAAAHIADFVGDESFCIFGHSMGAFVAYETEVILEAEHGKQATRLILSGQHPPVCFQPRRYGFDSEEELNHYLMHLGGFPEEVKRNLEMFHTLFVLCWEDIRLLEQYRPTCDVVQAETVVLCGDDDAEVRDLEKLIQWRETTPNLLEVKVFPGAHFYMREQEADFLCYIQQTIEGEKTV
ncbi:MAG: alpha/beta fold hydrolase [Evtepia sp.]|uniref:thioesterase II family protein n=1 Tax=Evtepia sp. TaxID=2773933 RepID=UPI002A760646|nr:alpha/beta fold hydrolase [Evtepia sp.]MDY3014803.1 alpha/beta fold hydrolase [Evtepia sp.]